MMSSTDASTQARLLPVMKMMCPRNGHLFTFILAISVAAGSLSAQTFFWDQATSGNWNDASNWNPDDAFPNSSTDQAIIDATGASYTVNLSTDISLSLLRLNSNDATLNHTSGTLTLGSVDTIELLQGTYTLDGGVVDGGRLSIAGGNLNIGDAGSRITNNAIIDGDIDLSQTSARIRFQSGADFTGDASLTGSGSTFLSYEYDTTLTDRTINLGTSSSFFTINNDANVVLASDVTIRGQGFITSDNFVIGNHQLTNEGTITNDTTGTLNIVVDNFINAAGGTVEVTNGGTLDFGGTNRAATNNGLLQASNGSLIILTGPWSSTGSILLDVTSTIELESDFTTADVSTINNSAGGTVLIQGNWDNTSSTFTFGTNTNIFTLDGGNISGGTLTPGSTNERLAFSNSFNNILSNNLVYDGDLILDQSTSRVRLQSGADFTGDATLSGAGTPSLYFEDTRTYDNRTINLNSTNATLSIEGNNTVTLGSNTIVRGQGNIISDSVISGTQTLINEGTITNDTASTLNIDVDTFTNASGALVQANNGGTLNFGSVSHVSNNAGTIQVLNNSLVRLRGTWSSTGNITLDNTSTLELENDFTTADVSTIDNSAGGTVLIQGNWDNTSNTFTFGTNTNIFTLDGGNISGGTLTPGSTSERLAFSNSFNNILSNNLVYDGDLILDQSTSRVRLQSGADFTGDAILSGAGTPSLYLEDTRTYDNRTINLNSTNATLSVEGTNTATLGSNTLVRGQGNIISDSVISGTQTLVNEGTITNDTTNTLNINVDTFTNASGALVQANNGGTLNFGSVSHVSNNAGTIQALNSSLVRLRGTWSSTGTITLDSTSTIELENDFTTADVSTINNSAGGTVLIQGNWDNTSNSFTFGTNTNTFTIDSGNISGGTLTPGSTNERLIFSNSFNNILSNNLVYDGDLILDQSTSRVRLQSGADFTGDAILSGAGSPTLYLEDTRTYDNRTIHLNTSNATLSVEGTNTATLGSNTLVRGQGNINSNLVVGGTQTLINEGTITNDTANTFNINVDTFTNASGGLVQANNGGTLNFGSGSHVSNNAGTIQALNGSIVRLRGTWSSTGNITLDNTSTIELENDFTTADVSTIDNSAGGTVLIQGNWDNTSNTFTFGTNTNIFTLDTGTISGGTLTPGSTNERLAFSNSFNNILSNNLVYDGDLILDQSTSRVRLQSGADFTGDAILSGASTPSLYLEDTKTYDNRTIHLNTSSATLSVEGTNTATLGSNTLVRGQGNISSDSVVGGDQTLINEGTVTNDTGNTLNINVDTFTNASGGLVQANNGGTLNFGSSGHVSNNVGTIQALNSSLVRLRGTWSSSGNITLDNTSTLELEDDFTTASVSTIDNSAGGTVLIQGNWDNTSNTFTFGTNTNIFTLDGGNISGGTLTPGSTNERLIFTNSFSNILSNNLVYDGDLILDQNTSRVRLQSGADFTGDAILSGVSTPSLYLEDTKTYDNRTINLNTSSATLSVEGNNTATLGSNTLVRGQGNIISDSVIGGNQTLINEGTITNDTTNSLNINVDTFTNASGGLVQASSGGTLNFGSSGHVSSNAGIVQALNSSLVRLRGTWSSTGTITLDSTSTIELENDFTTADVSTINNSAGGTVLLQGNWDNTSNTFTFGTNTNTFTLDNGTISGGTLTPGSTNERLTFSNSFSNILNNNLVYDGDLVLDQNTSRARLQSGADFTGDAEFSGAGSPTLSYEYSAALDDRTFNLDSNGSIFTIEGNNTVTLGANTLLRGRGTVRSDSFVSGTQTLINQGTIRADISGSTLTLSPEIFDTTTGDIEAENGGTLRIISGYTQTTGATRLDNGTINAQINTSTNAMITTPTVEGSGSILADLTIMDTLRPSMSAGTLFVDGDVTLDDGAISFFELGGLSQGNEYDFFDISGSLNLDGNLSLSLIDDFQSTLNIGDTFNIIETTDGISGSFNNVLSGETLNLGDGSAFTVHYGTGSSFNNDFVVLETIQVVPEPETYLLFALGLSITIIYIRRRA